MNCNDALGLIPDLVEWADQYQAEIEKQCSARASQIESLLIAGDYEAIREWLNQWQQADKVPGSLRDRYQKVCSELREKRSHQHQLYGSVIDRITGRDASADSLDGSSADSPTQEKNSIVKD